MLGFVFGTACLIGLVAVLRRGRWGHHGFGRRRMLNRLFSRLETSPSQEKAVVAAFDEVHAALGALRGELQASRSEAARLLREEVLDPEAVAVALARHDDALAKVRAALTGSFVRVHETLDPEQRARLARLIEAGPFRRPHRHGPYREAVSF